MKRVKEPLNDFRGSAGQGRAPNKRLQGVDLKGILKSHFSDSVVLEVRNGPLRSLVDFLDAVFETRVRQMQQDKEISSNDSVAQGAQRRARKSATVSTQDSQQMIAKAAYYRAQARGFAPGCELDDWLAAEVEVGPARDEAGPA